MSNPVAPPPTNDGSYPPPPATQGLGDAPAPKKKGGALKSVLSVVLVLVVGVGFYFVRHAISDAKALPASVGNCLKMAGDLSTEKEQETSYEVVKCDASGATHEIVGRIAGVTSTASDACDQYFKEGENYSVVASEDEGGYLLCLKPKA